MAKVRLSGLVSDIRGKIGGSYFKMNREGLTLSNFKNKTRKHTERSVKAHGFVSKAQNAWRGLTDNQRLQYDRYAQARTKVARGAYQNFQSGFNLFLNYHIYALRVGLPVIENVFLQPFALHQGSFEIVRSDGGLLLQRDTNLPTDQAVIVACTFPVLNTINNPGGRLRFIAGFHDIANDFDITDEYIAVFGRRPAVDEKIFFQTVEFRNDIPEVASPQLFSTLVQEIV